MRVASAAAGGLTKPGRVLPSRELLYLTLGLAVIPALTVSAGKLLAQDELPQIVVREGPKTKKDNGPRALGLLRLNSNGTATLVPVAIMINGTFYDASAYKADPVPMALESGTVYEAERSGDSLGLFTVNGARQSRNPNSQNPWLGTGSYLPNGSAPPRHGMIAANVPVGMDDDEGPPRLTRGSEPHTVPGAPSTAKAPAAAGKQENQAPSSTPSSVPNGSGANPPAKPNAEPGTSKQPEQTAPPPAKDSGANPQASSGDDSYRPTLRRGKPTQPLPDDDDTTAESATSKAGQGKPAATSDKNAPQLIPAISDAAGPEPRSYKFEWRKGEEGDRRQQMLDLAEKDFTTYLAQQAKNTISPKMPASKTASRRKHAANAAKPVLENVQFQAFDVWANNQPVMILNAEANIPKSPATAKVTGEPRHYWITLVARTDIYGDLHKLYLGVTDKYDLDVTPRLELIDVVDADGDGRGELLFRETSDAGTGYVIYRATADTLWKMFDSLNPE